MGERDAAGPGRAQAGETLASPGDEIERFLAQLSPLWCLPQSLVGPDAEPVGTLLRPQKLRNLAQRAGFADVTVLDIHSTPGRPPSRLGRCATHGNIPVSLDTTVE